VKLLICLTLIVGQIAGPWLCCCGSARAIAAILSFESTCAKSSTKHCSLCKKSNHEHQDTTRNHQKPQTPNPSDRCPCCVIKFLATIPNDPSRDTEAVATWCAFLSAHTFVSCPTTAIVSVANRAGLPGTSLDPFLTVSDRLYAHHVLRC
jgi:hypothetical protein